MQDGFPTPTVMFRDGDQYVRINLPTGWKVAGSSSELHFDNATLPGALVTIRLSSLTSPDQLDAAWIETVKPLLLGSVPKDSKNGRIANITPDALNIAGWKSIEFKMVYDQFGKSMVNDWLFLKLSDGRFLEVICTGRDQNFTVIRDARHYILAGWGSIPASLLK